MSNVSLLDTFKVACFGIDENEVDVSFSGSVGRVLYHPSLLPCPQVMVQENDAIGRHTSSPNPTFTL